MRVDQALRHYKPRRCTVIGGYTNGGKSTLTVQLLTGLALRNTGTALICLEDEVTIASGRQVAALLDELDTVRRIANDEPLYEDLALVQRYAQEFLRDVPMDIVYGKGWTRDQVTQAIYDAARRGAKVVAVDYIQCMRGKPRSEYLSECVDMWKTAASRVGVHLIIVSQVRRPEVPPGKRLPRPTKFMLKETGDIENQAEYVLLPFRAGQGSGDILEEAAIYLDKGKDSEPGVIDAQWDTERHIYVMEGPEEEQQQLPR